MERRLSQRTCLGVALAMVVGACAPASAPSASTEASPSSPAPAASTSPSALAAPSVSFGWPDGETPTVSRATTGLKESFINPGAVIEGDGELHMYANLFTQWPGRVQVVHLRSADGVDWTPVGEGPMLTSDDVPFAKPGADVSTGFIRTDGTWVLLFETVNHIPPWELGVATAPGPDGPWTVAPEPILTAGQDGEWDAGGLAWPSVVPTSDGWALYYSTYETNRRATVIGRATSADGASWTKDPEPVLVPEVDWEGTGLDRPRVVPVGHGFLMVYAGSDLTDRGIATSTDGVTWTRDGQLPAITMGDFPVTGRAWDAALIERDGELTYFLEIGAGTQALGTEVYRATATLP